MNPSSAGKPESRLRNRARSRGSGGGAAGFRPETGDHPPSRWLGTFAFPAGALGALGLACWTAAAAPAQAVAVLTNSLGMEFVRIDPETFTMGSGNDLKRGDTPTADYDEQPAHRVTITRPFYMLRSSVAPADYQRSGLAGSARDVSWNNASAFCEWLSRKEGRTYRLPTEAEWEHAFQRAKTNNSRTTGSSATQIASDFEGREWVQDWHGTFPPDQVNDPRGPVVGATRVIRDGARRVSLSPDATSKPWELSPTAFRIVLEVEPPMHPFVGPPPFNQAAVKQTAKPALQGPEPRIAYFKVRFALPLPPENDTGLNGPLAGLDASVMAHQHSPGFEVLPNGDLLAVYFSARDSRGTNECDPGTRFVQARLRYGAEEWDPPELFCDFKPLNDQSGLLWTDGDTVRFFGGGRGVSPWLPFKMGVSTNNGATWTFTLPHLDAPATNYAPQPIVNAFRAPGGAIFFASDAEKDSSFLWRSADNGIHWHDMGGRTGGRHSTIVATGESGDLLSIGGKQTSINGWSPQNRSSDWGAHWSESQASAFPALGGNQRPCLIRLANGHLCFASDSYHRKTGESPARWPYGQGCIVALSTNNGTTWRIKRLPVELPHESDRRHGTLGYATLRQAPNGMIHLLATMTHPCLHYEFNEAWLVSEAGDVAPESGGGVVHPYLENYPGGGPRVSWSARTCSSGRYLLDGLEAAYYENGKKQYEVTYANGRKTGTETFWAPDGTKVWSWFHHPEKHTSTWVHYWNNGNKRIESQWTTQPAARDLDRKFIGLAADGPASHWSREGGLTAAYSFTNGSFAGKLSSPELQRTATLGRTGTEPREAQKE